MKGQPVEVTSEDGPMMRAEMPMVEERIREEVREETRSTEMVPRAVQSREKPGSETGVHASKVPPKAQGCLVSS